jgi:hypothetical protein
MRREHKLGKVREQKLKQLGFDFSHNSFVAAWEQHYVELLRFKQDWGHCNVPTGPMGRQTTGISASFVAWVDQQRRNYKSNRHTLTPLRRSRLTSVGFVWDGIQACWEESLAALVLHCKGYGQVSHHARASSDWVSTGALSVSRLQVADGGERPAACAGRRGVPVWRRGPRVLVADATKLPPRLSAWLYEQRARFARGSLTSHRVQVNRFTCFTTTQVQVLTQKGSRRCSSSLASTGGPPHTVALIHLALLAPSPPTTKTKLTRS